MSRDFRPGSKPQLNGLHVSPGPSPQSRYNTPDRKLLSHTSNSPIAKYVLAAEFDVKVGAVVKHQVPRKIPGFKEHLATIGELMIPSSSEHIDNSYSVFVLYKDSTGKYRFLPDTDKDMLEEGALGFQHMSINEMNTIFEKTTEDDDVLFFFTVTKSLRSREHERGRVIRATSIGTPLRNFVIFKHLITLTGQLYLHDGQRSHLISLFNTVNSTDISLWRSYLAVNPHLYNLLSLNYEFNSRIILSHFKNIKTKDMNAQAVKYKHGVLQYFPSYDMGMAPEDSVMTKIPLNLSLSMHPSDIITDLKVTNAIMKFLHELSSKLNVIDYKNLKILIYTSTNVDFLTSFILTLSNFFNGFNKTYFHNDRILYFPLIDLYTWDKVLEFDTHTKNTKIIGTNNIILKENTDFYDFFYDLDTRELTVSDQLETYPVSIGKTHDFMELTQTLLQEQHDYNTIRVSLQRFNLWEIIKILNREDTDQAEVNLKDYYLSRNKNLVLFDEFFETKTIRLIEVLSSLILLLNMSFSEFSEQDITNLISHYDFFYTFVTTQVHGRLEMFLYLLEIFPTNITAPQDLIFDVEVSLASQRLISDIFKPILFEDDAVQKRVVKLFNVLCKSSLRVVLEQRLNPFVRIAMEEYTARLKSKSVLQTVTS